MKSDDSNFEYIYNFVDTICKKFGPRYSCSEAEKKANVWIKEELDNFCDETFLDEFETRPNLYPQGLLKVAGFFIGISFVFILLRFPLPIFSFIFILLGLFVLYTELFLMKEWIRFLFKKGTSSNAFGIIKPTKNVKFRLIFEGHTDSAKEMTIAKYSKKSPRSKIFLGIFYIIITSIYSIWKFIAVILSNSSIIFVEWLIFSLSIFDFLYLILFFATYPFFIWLIKGFLGKTVVLGANDNLIASAICAGIGKYLSNNRPRNIEVWIGSQGSEEVGDKGAKAFVQKYGKLGKLDNSYTIVLDSCGAGSEIFLIQKDMHKARYSNEIIEKILIAHDLLKKENEQFSNYRLGKVIIGSCDACRFIHKGYKAAAIFAVDSGTKKPKNWHTTQDIPENLEKPIILDVFNLCLKLIENIDAEFD